MTALPSIASFTGAAITEGDFKTAISNLNLFLSGLLGTSGNATDAQAALGALLGAGALIKTGAYTVDVSDRGKIIACSGTFTISLPDAGSVGSGFAVAVANYDVGTITVDPFSTQTIDGDATKTLIGNSMAVCCAVNGEWLTVGGTPTATTSRAGIVQLVDSVGSTSQTLAPTANACKVAYDTGAYAQALANNAQATANSRLSTDIGHSAVGSICFVRRLTSPGASAVLAGGTIAGSSLYPACVRDGNVTYQNTALTGTWRILGVFPGGQSGFNFEDATLAQRIS